MHYRERSTEAGFTLIELLVVMVVISVLSGIMLSQFISYRVRAYDLMAETDLKNGVTAQEALFAATETYAACPDRIQCEAALPGFRSNENISIAFTLGAGDTYVGESTHPLGSITWEFDSSIGSFQAR